MRSSPRPSFFAATLLALILLTGSPTLRAGDASSSPASSPAPAKPAPTPVPLAKVSSEAESTFGELRQIDEIASTDRTALASTASGLSSLTTEINARLVEDSRILAGSPSLELLYQLRTSLQTFADGLSSSEQDLNQRATTLSNRIARLSEMNQIWQTTLQVAPQVDMPPAVVQRVQKMADDIKSSLQTAQSDRAEVLTLQSDL